MESHQRSTFDKSISCVQRSIVHNSVVDLFQALQFQIIVWITEGLWQQYPVDLSPHTSTCRTSPTFYLKRDIISQVHNIDLFKSLPYLRNAESQRMLQIRPYSLHQLCSGARPNSNWLQCPKFYNSQCYCWSASVAAASEWLWSPAAVAVPADRTPHTSLPLEPHERWSGLRRPWVSFLCWSRTLRVRVSIVNTFTKNSLYVLCV